MKKEDLVWFKNPDCQAVEITDFKTLNDEKPARKIVISETDKIREIINLIQALPVEGEIMKSFGRTIPYTRLQFHCANQTEIVEFYGGKIKTPSTSFYTRDQKFEDQAFQLVQNFLKPTGFLQGFLSQIGL